jgi:hypothetical protein
VRRISIRLPDPALVLLEQRAQAQGEPVASAASNLLRTALENGVTESGGAKSRVAPRRSLARTSTRPTPGAPWIAPEDDPDWHERMWGAIVALYERYPRVLARLEHDWYEHTERVETLTALAVWRANIDAAGEDPREELAFQAALLQLGRILDNAPSSERRFKPDARMPTGWMKAVV